MAFLEELAGESPVTYTIHVWPARELLARSWGWPERRRQAYAQIAGALALAVATQVLEGGTFALQEIEFAASIGCVTFTILQAGTTIHITISDFTSPDGPPPNGGIGMQPCAIDGLVLGLRGSNGYFHVVVFHGVLPSIPNSNVLSVRYVRRMRLAARVNKILLPTNLLKLNLEIDSAKLGCDPGNRDRSDTCKDAKEHENSNVDATLRKSLAVLPSRVFGIRFARAPDIGKAKKGVGIFCGETWSCDLSAPPGICLYRRRQSDHMQGHYRH